MIISRIIPYTSEGEEYEQVPIANMIELVNNANQITPTTIIADPFPLPLTNQQQQLLLLQQQQGRYRPFSTYSQFLSFSQPQQISYAQPITPTEIQRTLQTTARPRPQERNQEEDLCPYSKQSLQSLPFPLRIFIYFLCFSVILCICILFMHAVIAEYLTRSSERDNNNSGYFHTIFYRDASCSSLPVYQIGSPTGNCFPYYNASSLMSNSSARYLYSPTNTTFIVFSQKNCEGYVLSEEITLYHQCLPVQNVNGLYQSSFYSPTGYVNVINTVSLENSGYADSGCHSSTERMSIAVDVCVPTSITSSVFYLPNDDEGDYMKYSYSTDTNCSGDKIHKYIYPSCHFINEAEPSIAPFRTYSIDRRCK